MKNYENRINILEKKIIPQKPERSIILTEKESNDLLIDGEKYHKPSDMETSIFLSELEKKNIISKNKIVVYTVKPSED